MKIVIMGAGGHGRVVLDILQQDAQYEVVGFIDSDTALHGREVDGLPVMGDIAIVPRLKGEGVKGAIVAIGDNKVRDRFARAFKEKGFVLVNAVHPDASIARNAGLGQGVVVASGAIICAHARIGDNAIINTGAIVEHECVVGDSVHVGPGVKIAGRTTIKRGAHIGIGSTIIQNLVIGENAVIGAGSVVLQNVPDNVTVVGVPARVV